MRKKKSSHTKAKVFSSVNSIVISNREREEKNKRSEKAHDLIIIHRHLMRTEKRSEYGQQQNKTMFIRKMP